MTETNAMAAIVTGASSGIGRAVALRFIEQGMPVIAVDLPGRDFSEIDVASVIEADLSSVDSTRRLPQQLVQALAQFPAGPSALVNCAGVSGRVADFANVDETDERLVFEVNYFGLGAIIRAVLPLFRGGGAIVNVASLDGLRARPRMSHYSASKHAVVGLTRSLAREVAPQGIRVNAVAPGPIETEMMNSIVQMEPQAVGNYRQNLIDRVPLGRYGRPDEVAAVICFLAGDGASYVTGAIWAIDGGVSS